MSAFQVYFNVFGDPDGFIERPDRINAAFSYSGVLFVSVRGGKIRLHEKRSRINEHTKKAKINDAEVGRSISLG